jgi:nucleoside-triphosphatase
MEKPVTGFFTREIKEQGKRVGFSIITIDGKKGVLAHEDIRDRPKVGKYGVNLHDINRRD